MARIAGVNLPTNKRVVIALTYIHGIGNTKAQEIATKLSIAPERRVQDLSDQEVLQIREAIDADHTVEGDLRRDRPRRSSVEVREPQGPSGWVTRTAVHRVADPEPTPSGRLGGAQEVALVPRVETGEASTDQVAFRHRTHASRPAPRSSLSLCGAAARG